MSFALKLLAANVTSLAAVIGAIVLAHAGITGRGWFLLIALMTSKTVYSSPSKEESSDA
jgi:hypothetical protein